MARQARTPERDALAPPRATDGRQVIDRETVRAVPPTPTPPGPRAPRSAAEASVIGPLVDPLALRRRLELQLR
jgi:hypothetical protein